MSRVFSSFKSTIAVRHGTVPFASATRSATRPWPCQWQYDSIVYGSLFFITMLIIQLPCLRHYNLIIVDVYSLLMVKKCRKKKLSQLVLEFFNPLIIQLYGTRGFQRCGIPQASVARSNIVSRREWHNVVFLLVTNQPAQEREMKKVEWVIISLDHFVGSWRLLLFKNFLGFGNLAWHDIIICDWSVLVIQHKKSDTVYSISENFGYLSTYTCTNGTNFIFGVLPGTTHPPPRSCQHHHKLTTITTARAIYDY